jgi:hypothetical protein
MPSRTFATSNDGTSSRHHLNSAEQSLRKRPWLEATTYPSLTKVGPRSSNARRLGGGVAHGAHLPQYGATKASARLFGQRDTETRRVTVLFSARPNTRSKTTDALP